MTTFNPIVESIGVSNIRLFDFEVNNIPNIIKLTLGEPNFDTPDHIKHAAIQAIHDNHSHYTPNAGIIELREATAKYYNEKFNLNYTAEQVVTTVGATQAILATLQTLLSAGDSIIIPTPVFPIYMSDANLVMGDFVCVDTSSDNFILTAQALERTILEHPNHQFKAVVLVYPSNPTGVTYSKEQLEDLSKVIEKYNLWAICDEIYAELTYDKTHVSMATIIPDRTILITGLSKSHAMTGWRIGYILGPEPFIQQVIKPHQYMVTTPTSISQYAALAAMTNGQNDCMMMLNEYRQRRDYMIKELRQLDFDIASPDGAFYLFAKIPPYCLQNSWDFVRDLAQKAQVALIPGVAFGQGGEGYVRISYAASMEELQLAVSRIKHYIQTVKN